MLVGGRRHRPPRRRLLHPSAVERWAPLPWGPGRADRRRRSHPACRRSDRRASPGRSDRDSLTGLSRRRLASTASSGSARSPATHAIGKIDYPAVRSVRARPTHPECARDLPAPSLPRPRPASVVQERLFSRIVYRQCWENPRSPPTPEARPAGRPLFLPLPATRDALSLRLPLASRSTLAAPNGPRAQLSALRPARVHYVAFLGARLFHRLVYGDRLRRTRRRGPDLLGAGGCWRAASTTPPLQRYLSTPHRALPLIHGRAVAEE